MLSVRSLLALGLGVLVGCASKTASPPASNDDRHTVAAPQPGDAAPPAPQDAAAMLEDGFPEYPNARALTNGHVNGGPGGLHIAWWTTATPDEPAVVIAYYQRLGVTPTERDQAWHFATGEYRLSVLPSAGLATFRGPGNEVPAAANERTVLVFSRAVGLKP